MGRREGPLKESAALHRGIDILAIDVCGEGAPAEVIRTAIQRWGRIDHLINNAGATAVMRLADTDERTITNLLA
ncbi:SDR family NAD(P)-dependent oxidoreductase [Streptomyces sp. 2-1]|uniref:SDR family NAD(P)-dependent oxidoreductase n=1 Tax=Streptomyces sp. 2-1 TaxID=412710 RepID=UPI003AFA9B7E